MATVTGLTAERMQEIIDSTIVDADIIDNHLILTKDNGGTIDAGELPSAEGGGIDKVTAFPTDPAPEDGDMIVRIDQPGDPVYKFTDGAWERQPRMGAITVPSCKITHSANQAVSAGATVTLTFDTERYDKDAMHDGTNPTRITFKTPGVYRVFANLSLTAVYNATDEAPVQVRLNGTDVLGYSAFQPLNGSMAPLSFDHEFKAGDYIELRVTGGNQPLTIAGNQIYSPNFGATWLGGAGQTVDERGSSAVKLKRIAAQNISTSNTWTAVQFNEGGSELYDTEEMHDAAVNNGQRITIKTPGLYRIHAHVRFATNASGSLREFKVQKNGDTSAGAVAQDRKGPSQVGGTYLGDSQDVLLAAGDYLELLVQHDVGAGLAVESDQNMATVFGVSLVATGKTVTPGARLEKTVAQSIPSAVSTAISWDAAGERADNDLMWDVSQPTRLVCRTAGWYIVAAGLSWAANSGSFREVAIQKTLAGGGATTVASERSIPVTTAGYSHPLSIPALVELAVGDYIEVMARQEIGSGLNVNASPGSYLAAVKIGAPAGPSSGIEVVESPHIIGAAGEPAFANGFTSGSPAVSFYKDRGRVHFAGALNPPTGSNGPAFTLPAGYRPPATVTIPIHYWGNPNEFVGRMEVQSDGTVRVYTQTNGLFGASNGIRLEDVSFRI